MMVAMDKRKQARKTSIKRLGAAAVGSVLIFTPFAAMSGGISRQPDPQNYQFRELDTSSSVTHSSSLLRYNRTTVDVVATFQQAAFIAISAEEKAATFSQMADGSHAAPETRYFKQVSATFVKNTQPLVMSCDIYANTPDFSAADASKNRPCQDLIPTNHIELVETGGEVTRRVVFNSAEESQASLVSINFSYL